MGAGRKSETHTLPEKHQQVSTTMNHNTNFRNLKPNDLGGVVFGCTHYTMEECLSNQIFGLPNAHFSYIKNIKPGLPLFLFNYSDRKLHGIFEAASSGETNINPFGWSKMGTDRTRYPAQVRVQMRKQCQPLTEKQFKKVISGNYYTQVHFQFELDHAQTGGLISLFESSPMSGSVVSWIPKAAPKWQSPVKPIPNHDKKQEKKLEKQDSWPSVSDDDFAQSDHLNTGTWSQTQFPHSSSNWDVLRDNLETDASNEDKDEDGDEDSRPSTSEIDVPCFDQTNVESGALCPTPCVDEDNVEVENEEELVYRKLKQLVHDRECSKSHLVGDEENAAPPETKVAPLDKDCAPEVPSLSDKENAVPYETNVTPLEYDCAPEASLFSTKKYEEVPVNSSYLQALINQVRREVDELKASSLEQRQKTLLLERKLTDSDIQVQQLTIRVKELESQLVPSSTYVDETSNQPPVSWETSEDSFVKPPLCDNKLVYIIGGYDGNSWLSALDCYSPSMDSIKSLTPMSSFRSYTSAAALNGDIYIFGGGDGGNMWYDTVESYSPLRNEWTSRPSLIKKKGSLAGATLHGKIYAIGGGDGIECFSDVEMFDPAIGTWIGAQSMLQKRFSSAAVELNGVIYAVGGFDAHNNYLKSAERFDPREVVSWSQLPNMNTSRASHSLVVLNEKLYALGGYDGTKMIPSIEVFDPRMDSWIAGDEMKESRGYSVAAVIGESIFVISGLKEGRTMTDTVEFYKEGHGWSVANVKGVGKRCFCSGVTL